jgi:hypothetical protein
VHAISSFQMSSTYLFSTWVEPAQEGYIENQ